jgi:hypothetical protein
LHACKQDNQKHHVALVNLKRSAPHACAGTNQMWAPKEDEDGFVLDDTPELSLSPEVHELVTKRFVEYLSAQVRARTSRTSACMDPWTCLHAGGYRDHCCSDIHLAVCLVCCVSSLGKRSIAHLKCSMRAG